MLKLNSGRESPYYTKLNKGETFDETSTKALGIETAKPTFKGPTVIRWEPAGKLTSVAVFELNGKVDYAFVKVSTK